MKPTTKRGRPRKIPHTEEYYCRCIDCRRKRGEFEKNAKRRKLASRPRVAVNLAVLAEQLSKEDLTANFTMSDSLAAALLPAPVRRG